AVLVSDFEPRVMLALGAIALLKMGLDVFFVRRIRGVPMHLGHHLLGPIKDALMGAAWIYSAFSRTVTWRGVRLRLGAQSRLRPDNGALPIRLARRLLRV
ncbi:MAG: hypothetical protein OEY14_08480, partial [Myxococcales bacterium]|nr:hypothetical protein [Myxococcales bacterium]